MFVHTILYQSLTIKITITYRNITITCSYHGTWNSNLMQERKFNEKYNLLLISNLQWYRRSLFWWEIITGEETSFGANYWSTFHTLNPAQAGSTKQMDTIPLTPTMTWCIGTLLIGRQQVKLCYMMQYFYRYTLSL